LVPQWNLSRLEPTQTRLAASPIHPAPGQAFTLAADVTSKGKPVSSGEIAFWQIDPPGSAIGSIALSATGQATTSLNGLDSGTYNFTAEYSGDAAHNASSALVAVTVGADTVPTTLPPTEIGSSGAKLNGKVNPGSPHTYVYFEYALNAVFTNYSSTAPVTLTRNNITQSFSLLVSGFASGTTYYY